VFLSSYATVTIQRRLPKQLHFRCASNHWEKTSHSLLVGAILHVLYAEPDKTLAGVASFLSDQRRPIETTLQAMMTTPHQGLGAGCAKTHLPILRSHWRAAPEFAAGSACCEQPVLSEGVRSVEDVESQD
jgi:hypothetical protein